MKFQVRVKVKDCEGFGTHNTRTYVMFFAELIYDNKVTANSTIWCGTEQDAIQSAFSALARTSQEDSRGEENLTRTNYHPSDLEGYGRWSNAWGEIVREQNPDRRARAKSVWDEAHDSTPA